MAHSLTLAPKLWRSLSLHILLMTDILIDGHVHAVGNGSGGCSLSLRKWSHRILARIMLKSLGLPQSAMRGDLESIYIEKVISFVRESPISKIVLLALDHTYNSEGQSLPSFGSLYVPNNYVLGLAKKHQEIIPGISIHPARKDAIDELHRCHSLGAKLLKLLPNVQNVDCCDKRFTKFWETVASLKLPFLSHTGGELALPVFNKKYADPRSLKLPLECGVTVIAAHCGTSSGLFGERDYTKEFGEMLTVYPNLYGDNSGLNTPLRAKRFRELLSSPYRERMIHGSDIPIPLSARWVYRYGLINKENYLELKREKNPVALDFKIKEAIGFPKESFTLLGKLMGIN